MIESEQILKEDHEYFKQIMKECETLRWKKLNDYGKTYDSYGLVGLLVKLEDKYGRAKQLYKKSLRGEVPNFETLRDTLVDLVNYGVMSVMTFDRERESKLEKFPGPNLPNPELQPGLPNPNYQPMLPFPEDNLPHPPTYMDVRTSVGIQVNLMKNKE